MTRSIPLFATVFGLAALLCLPMTTLAQTAPIPQHVEAFVLDSGLHAGQGTEATVAYSRVVEVDGAPWLRLTFSDADLGAGSYLTVTSLLDGAQQRLDAQALAEWYDSSAYFNGDAVRIDLHVAPGDQGVFVRMDEVIVGDHGAPESQCGPTDDRIRSNDPKAGRIISIGCTGWLIHDNKVVSAGHCLGSGATTLQFNVPSSLSNGTLQHPGPQDQYSVDQASRVFVNGGVGNDWGVFRVFNNAQTGLQPHAAQGGQFAVRQDLGPPTIRITGYGVDTGVDNQTQQTHTGPNAGSSGTTMRYQVDTTGGNSGSPVIDEATGDAVGVHSHGGCTTAGTGNNSGTSLFNTAFWAAVGTPPPPGGDACLLDGFGYEWDIFVSNNFFTGFVETNNGAPTWDLAGARGTTGSTIRHHQFTALNAGRMDDGSCSVGGFVDWLTYNGRVTPTGGGSYNYNGRWANSCGGSGPVTGTITIGACPAPRSTPVLANGPATAGVVQFDAAASTVNDRPTRLAAYPNPAVDEATIAFEIPAAADVRVSVYDVLGREVAVLLDEAREAGSHTVVFDASSLSAGVYVYRVQAGAYSAAERLVLAH